MKKDYQIAKDFTTIQVNHTTFLLMANFREYSRDENRHS